MSLPRWQKAKKQHLPVLKSFVSENEEWCVPFAHSLNSEQPFTRNTVLVLWADKEITAALQVSPSGVIIPVFSSQFIQNTLHSPPPSYRMPARPFSFMGKSSWVELLEGWYGGTSGRRIEYYLMRRLPGPILPAHTVEGFTVTRVSKNRANALYSLQKGYELEEVLLDPSLFRERICRLNLNRILTEQHVFAAVDSDGAPCSKANTNAIGITCEQVGGVYTLPSHRGRGLAAMVMEALIRDISTRGRKACLFVKKSNNEAIDLYRRCGFDIIGSFFIDYPGRSNRP